MALDVASDASVRAAVEDVEREAGRVDVLVHNAGVSRVGPVVEQPLGEVLQVLDTNLLGVLRLIQAAVPGMMRRRRGLVVMVGSVVSALTTPWSAAYSSSKAALLVVADALRLEVLLSQKFWLDGQAWPILHVERRRTPSYTIHHDFLSPAAPAPRSRRARRAPPSRLAGPPDMSLPAPKPSEADGLGVGRDRLPCDRRCEGGALLCGAGRGRARGPPP